MRKLDLSGQRFGRLTVVETAPHIGGRTAWLCRCDCGEKTAVRTENLRAGVTRSCGCLRNEMLRERSLKHGHSGHDESREYKSWCHAKARCDNPNDEKYPRYGGRGVQMCDRWSRSFTSFFEDMGPCPDGHTLHRVDNDGDYEPENCEWATSRTQSRERSDNVVVTWEGRSFILKDLARHVGVDYKALHDTYRRQSMPLEAAVAEARERSPGKVDPEDVREMRRRYEGGGVTQYDLAEEYGISQSQVNNIIRRVHWADVD